MTVSAEQFLAVCTDRNNERVLRERAERELRSCRVAREGDRLYIERRVAERNELQRIVWAIATLKVWTNEDGKRFVFVDDLAQALEPVGMQEELTADVVSKLPAGSVVFDRDGLAWVAMKDQESWESPDVCWIAWAYFGDQPVDTYTYADATDLFVDERGPLSRALSGGAGT